MNKFKLLSTVVLLCLGTGQAFGMQDEPGEGKGLASTARKPLSARERLAATMDKIDALVAQFKFSVTQKMFHEEHQRLVAENAEIEKWNVMVSFLMQAGGTAKPSAAAVLQYIKDLNTEAYEKVGEAAYAQADAEDVAEGAKIDPTKAMDSYMRRELVNRMIATKMDWLGEDLKSLNLDEIGG